MLDEAPIHLRYASYRGRFARSHTLHLLKVIWIAGYAMLSGLFVRLTRRMAYAWAAPAGSDRTLRSAMAHGQHGDQLFCVLTVGARHNFEIEDCHTGSRR